LFDAVEMMPNPGWTDEAKNVSRVSHAVKTEPSWIFPTQEITAANPDVTNLETGSMRSPFGLDSSTTHTDVGMRLNNPALEWMIEQAKSAGVNVE
jgi:hypothetical protein